MQFVQGLVGLILGQKIAAKLDEPGGWNIFNSSYTKIHESLTCIVDSMIMKYGVTGSVMIISGGKTIPAQGTHYIHYGQDPNAYVGLIKIFIKHGKNEGSAYYTVYEPRYSYLQPLIWNVSPIQKFTQQLQEQQVTCIMTHRVDSTSFEPTLYSMTVKHPTEMFPYQETICRFIMTLYAFHKGGTVLISGKRGSGKTTAAMNVKKTIEREFENSIVTLISNFNPSQTSVDIFKLALRSANDINPHVVIVNEIETHLEIAAADPIDRTRCGDRRFSHTADRTTFHDMLDTIAGMRHVIMVFTTEKPIQELWARQEFRSFLRPGRIHGLARIEVKDGKTVAHVEGNKLSDSMAIE